jgi:outer membrane protein assembly factor BamB
MKMTMHSAVKLGMTMGAVGVFSLLTGCSTLNSWNPFAKAPANAPLALVNFNASMSPRLSWSYSIGRAGTAIFSPAYAAESVFVAAADGSLARLDAASGKAQWRISVGSNLTAGVGSDGDTVAVVGTKGVLMVFDGTGKLRWKEQLPSEVLSAPVVGDGAVVVRSGDNRVIAFDAQTGNKRWTSLRAVPALILRGAPGLVVDSGTVYVGQPGGKLLALNSLNGGPRWESVVGESRGSTELERVSDVVGHPVLAEHEICASSYQSRLACFDLGTGVVRWNKELSSQVGPAMDARFVFAADVKGVVSGFSRDAGQSVWRNEKLMYRDLSAPLSIGRAVAVGDYKGIIHFLSREDGSFLARMEIDGSPVTGAPLVAAGRAVFQTQAGTVVAIATE